MKRIAVVAVAVLAAATKVSAQQPELLNADEIGTAIGISYPDKLRQLALSGRVILELEVSPDGKVQSRRVKVSSGVRGFDRAALAIVGELELRPAMKDGVPVEGVLELPILFKGEEPNGTMHLLEATLINRDSAERASTARFPRLVRAHRVTAHSGVTLELDSAGLVQKAVLHHQSCYNEADKVALEVSRGLRFADVPGFVQRRQVNVTYNFGQDSVTIDVPGDVQPAVPDSLRRGPRQPAARPELRNRDEVGRALVRNYPPHLRDRGVGGQVTVWLLINERGDVERRDIADTSGDCALDLAAMEVARTASFSPAKLDGKPTKVWIQLPIHFRVR